MKSGEQKGSGENRTFRSRVGDALIWFCTGYTRAGVDEGVSWMKTYDYLGLDDESENRKWIKKREAELLAESGDPFPDQQRKVYTRARLENFCRRQGVMPDGRIVAQVPTFGTSREELAEVGILADNFNRNERPRENREQNLTVILPKEWTYGPVPADPVLQNERWALIRDEAGEARAWVLYEHRSPEVSDGGFRSFTRIVNEQPDPTMV